MRNRQMPPRDRASRSSFATGGCLLSLALLIGCSGGQKPPENPPAKAPPSSAGHEPHSHGAGPHGGAVADWGGGVYHVEFTVDHDKKEAAVYILGKDAKIAKPIKAKSLTLAIKDPSFQTELKPSPLEGETDGASSRFVGTHEKLGIVQEFEGTITGEIDGTPYSGDFKEEP